MHTISSLFISIWDCLPTKDTPGVPEIDGPGGIAAMALLASCCAVAYRRMQSR
ncbi:hypothetical protein [Hyphomicrobium methylovorum]|uniref:hypothetical protein n=1 Tax=Hyphomicrobium methylovorum TaxID=84 RepID=UPI0015E75E68|nr:hypothetical protein [Hyphomicrobium methylovorum]